MECPKTGYLSCSGAAKQPQKLLMAKDIKHIDHDHITDGQLVITVTTSLDVWGARIDARQPTALFLHAKACEIWELYEALSQARNTDPGAQVRRPPCAKACNCRLGHNVRTKQRRSSIGNPLAPMSLAASSTTARMSHGAKMMAAAKQIQVQHARQQTSNPGNDRLAQAGAPKKPNMAMGNTFPGNFGNRSRYQLRSDSFEDSDSDAERCNTSHQDSSDHSQQHRKRHRGLSSVSRSSLNFTAATAICLDSDEDNNGGSGIDNRNSEGGGAHAGGAVPPAPPSNRASSGGATAATAGARRQGGGSARYRSDRDFAISLEEQQLKEVLELSVRDQGGCGAGGRGDREPGLTPDLISSDDEDDERCAEHLVSERERDRESVHKMRQVLNQHNR